MKIIRLNVHKLRFWLFLGLIIGMPLSKYPSIALPAYNFTSFRLGLYQLLAVIFVLICVWSAFLKLRELSKQNILAVTSVIVIAVIALFGLLNALDKPRSILLVISILFLLSLVITGWWYVKYELKKSSYKFILNCLLWAGIFWAILGIGQFIFGSLSDSTLGIACRGCVSDIFGFPRVNLFTAEPQFFANSMLPLFFVAFAMFYKKYSRLALASLALTTVVIGITFSRGAYFALIIGLIAFIILTFYIKKLVIKNMLIAILIIFACGLASFGLMVASASYRYRATPNITYNTARSMLEHISLGVIVLPEKQVKLAPLNTVISPAKTESSDFVSPGLIEASTTDRLGAADLALTAWRSNLSTGLIGVGAGNLGPYVVKNIDSSAPNNLTVYIYYVLILAELGMAGLIAFLGLNLGAIWGLVKRCKSERSIYLAAFVATMFAFLAQYLFFGTYINTIYVWLFIGIVLGLAGTARSKT